MKCSRCGATAVTTRAQQYYCGRCALACDWEEIIAIAQEAVGKPDRGATPPPPERAPVSA